MHTMQGFVGSIRAKHEDLSNKEEFTLQVVRQSLDYVTLTFDSKIISVI